MKPFHAARAAIIEKGRWPRVVTQPIDRLVLEPEAGQDERDRRQLFRLARASGADSFSYAHVAPSTEPMLWVPDALAWAYGNGGDWRRRAAPVITDILNVDQLQT